MIDNNEITSGKKDKYLLLLASGGLVHFLLILSYAIEIAIEQNRILVIYSKHQQFRFSDYFTIDIDNFIYYDGEINKIPDNLKWKGLSTKEIIISDSHFPLNSDNPTEDALYRLVPSGIPIENDLSIYDKDEQLIVSSYKPRDYVKPILIDGKESMQIDTPKYFFSIKFNNDIIKKLQNEKNINDNYISIHFRNTDIKNEVDSFIEKAKELSDEKNIDYIYLLSDDNDAYEKFKEKLPEKKIMRNPVQQDETSFYGAGGPTINYNLVYDLYMALNSNYFIPCQNSGLSHYIFTLFETKQKVI